MRTVPKAAAGLLVLVVLAMPLPPSAQTVPPPALRIDIPVVLKDAKVVFNMDHLAFAGELPIGLGSMKIMSTEFAAAKVPWNITAIFHGAAGADLLPDVLVNSGANSRIVQLVQDGFVQIQP